MASLARERPRPNTSSRQLPSTTSTSSAEEDPVEVAVPVQEDTEQAEPLPTGVEATEMDSDHDGPQKVSSDVRHKDDDNDEEERLGTGLSLVEFAPRRSQQLYPDLSGHQAFVASQRSTTRVQNDQGTTASAAEDQPGRLQATETEAADVDRPPLPQQHDGRQDTQANQAMPVVKTRKKLRKIVDKQYDLHLATGLHTEDLDVTASTVAMAVGHSIIVDANGQQTDWVEQREGQPRPRRVLDDRERGEDDGEEEEEDDEQDGDESTVKLRAVVEVDKDGQARLWHYIEDQDSLVSLSFLYGVSQFQLRAANRMANTSNVQERDKLHIPLEVSKQANGKFRVTMADGTTHQVEENSNDAVREYNTKKLVNRFVLKAKGCSKEEARMYIEDNALNIDRALKQYHDDLLWEQLHTMPVQSRSDPRAMGNHDIWVAASKQLKVGDFSVHKPALDHRHPSDAENDSHSSNNHETDDRHTGTSMLANARIQWRRWTLRGSSVRYTPLDQSAPSSAATTTSSSSSSSTASMIPSSSSSLAPIDDDLEVGDGDGWRQRLSRAMSFRPVDHSRRWTKLPSLATSSSTDEEWVEMQAWK